MKKNRITFILIFIAFVSLSSATLKSQNLSDIETIDLDIIPPHGVGVDLSAASNQYTLTVKIEDIKSVDKVYFSLGNSSNPSDILTINATVNKKQNQYFIVVGNEEYLFATYTILLPVTLTKEQFQNLKKITFYLKDKHGKLTPEIYSNIP